MAARTLGQFDGRRQRLPACSNKRRGEGWCRMLGYGPAQGMDAAVRPSRPNSLACRSCGTCCSACIANHFFVALQKKVRTNPHHRTRLPLLSARHLKDSDDDDDTGRDATTGAAAESVCPKEPHRCRRRERRKKANQSYPVTRTCPVLRCTTCGGATRRPEIFCLYFASIRLPPFYFVRVHMYVTRYDSRMSRGGRTLREMEEVWTNARRKLQLTERLRIVMHGLARLYACGVGPGPEGEIIDRQGVSIDARLLQMW